jgi:branched-chain amino acid transport system permease protein
MAATAAPRLTPSFSLSALAARVWPLLAPAAIVTALVLLSLLGTDALERKATFMLVNLAFVLGLYTFVGNSGVLSFAHAAFMAVGAYTFAFMTARVQVKNTLLPDAPEFLRDADIATIPAILLAAAMPAILALILSPPLMRLSGLPAGIATLAVLFAVGVVVGRWESLTGGQKSFSTIRRDTDIYSALVWALIVMAIVFLYQQSRFGLRLRGTREDFLAARSVGISVVRARTIAWVLSAALVGISGALWAGFLGTITPGVFFIGTGSGVGNVTFITIAMLVVGGIYSMSGAVIGTVFVSGISEALRELEKVSGIRNITEIALALILLLVLILRPKGITGSKEIYWPFSRSQTVGRGLLEPPPTVAVAQAPTGVATPPAGPSAKSPRTP